MKKRLTAFLSLLLPVACIAADPYLGYIYPAGIRPGSTNRFIVGGQNLWRLRGMHFGSSGLRVVGIESVPRFTPPTGLQKKHLKNWLDGIAKGNREEPRKPDDPHISEWRSNSWWRALGTLDPLKISIVEHYLFTQRNPLQDTPSLRQTALVTIAADSDVEPGVYDASLWNDSGISPPRPFLVSPLSRIEEPLYVPPHRKAPDPPVVDATLEGAVLDGQILPGQTDTFRLRLSGGRRYSVKVLARELQPYVGDAVPGFFNPAVVVRDGNGNIIAKADDADRFRPDPLFDFKPPSPEVYTLEVHDVLYRGRADFVYAIAVEPYATPDSNSGGVLPPDNTGNVLKRCKGTVGKAGAVSECEFDVEKPGPLVFDVMARRNGSSLDAVLTLRKRSGGTPLIQWDDVTNKVFVGTIPQGECDPVGSYWFKEPGRYVAEITDRTGHGGPEYFWNMEIRRPTPDFEVLSSRSTLPLFRGRPLKVDFVVLRKDGFNGNVTLEFPKGIAAKGNVATAGVERLSVMLTYVGRSPVELCSVKVSARAKVNGMTIRRQVIPCDEYEQAFAWRHFVPAKSFVMRATPGKQPPPRKRHQPRKKQQNGKSKK